MNGCRFGLSRSDHHSDDHVRERGRPAVVRDRVAGRGREQNGRAVVVQRVDVPPMVESVLDVRRPRKVLQTAVRSDEKIVFGFGSVRRRRQSDRHGTAANIRRVVRAIAAGVPNSLGPRRR